MRGERVIGSHLYRPLIMVVRYYLVALMEDAEACNVRVLKKQVAAAVVQVGST